MRSTSGKAADAVHAHELHVVRHRLADAAGMRFSAQVRLAVFIPCFPDSRVLPKSLKADKKSISWKLETGFFFYNSKKKHECNNALSR